MTQSFRYRGNLAETSLPEMLYSIDRFRVPGIVEAKHRDVTKRIYVRDGYILHAASTDRRDSLGVYLRRQGTLSEDELDDITRERESSEKRFGVLLIERGLYSPAQVLEAIRQQIEGIVWSLFYWQEGEVTFGVGELREPDMVQIQLPIGQVILRGIQRAPDAKQLVARMGRKETRLQPSYRGEDLIELGLEAEEHEMLRLVDGKRSLYDLCSDGPKSPAENAKLLYAFQVLHLVARPGARRARRETAGGPVKVQLPTSGDRFSS